MAGSSRAKLYFEPSELGTRFADTSIIPALNDACALRRSSASPAATTRDSRSGRWYASLASDVPPLCMNPAMPIAGVLSFAPVDEMMVELAERHLPGADAASIVSAALHLLVSSGHVPGGPGRADISGLTAGAVKGRATPRVEAVGASRCAFFHFPAETR